MAGAHLDSVVAGPGINDNGSGSATLLEIGRGRSRKLQHQPENRIRFAWWGAEEEGLRRLDRVRRRADRGGGADIALYLNFDMIGSPNFARLIYDGDGSKFGAPGPAGSDTIERTFERYFDRVEAGQRPDGVRRALGLRAVHRRRDPRRRPVHRRGGGQDRRRGAKYGGTAGEAFDPCYHQACDDIDNISRRGLNQMSDAVAHAVNHYAYSLKFIPRPEETTKAKGKVKKAAHSKYLGDSLRK